MAFLNLPSEKSIGVRKLLHKGITYFSCSKKKFKHCVIRSDAFRRLSVLLAHTLIISRRCLRKMNEMRNMPNAIMWYEVQVCKLHLYLLTKLLVDSLRRKIPGIFKTFSV